ncbi:MAG: M48 family metallopeptidase [Bacteroidales bacterium]|jgi:hypothetical protein|nr:M48 family metallopeptidase [Bacteroidales bacterium]MDD2824659.1 M48 family metallopeptidase [Bacteroidales bacterium]MDD3100155.1 M48 family metallopeptidase [Bacteroidales bacterium]MDD3638806.1 M48 family metallopeptidase [Bacteroidales bacterium]MDD3943107.1 M48 family metallopeptidase [Bacteroidales bacterium]
MGICKAGDIVFTLHRSTRKSVGLSVGKDGSVRVRAPFWLPYCRIEQIVLRKTDWICSRRLKVEQQFFSIPPPGPDRNDLTTKANLKFRVIAGPWVEHFRMRYNVEPAKWTVRDMHTRWGSCSLKTRRITLNLKLFHKADPCVEYVIVHELCHLIHPDHGKEFYALLEKELPDWKSRRKQLKA